MKVISVGLIFVVLYVNAAVSYRIGGFADDLEGTTCAEEGVLYPHENCAKFYQCDNGILVPHECALGTYFNPRAGYCDFIENVPECVGGTRPPIGTTQNPVTTDGPTNAPTDSPTDSPSDSPTNSPTDSPTDSPSDSPTNSPTDSPTDSPSDSPTNSPTDSPTDSPSDSPTNSPTDSPTDSPSDSPTNSPTDSSDSPTNWPTNSPTDSSDSPTNWPTNSPTDSSDSPTNWPTNSPTDSPSDSPTNSPTDSPTNSPTDDPGTDRPPTEEPVTDEPVETTTQDTRVCKLEGVYKIPYPGNCSLYILCVNHEAYTQLCPEHTYYDPDIQQCNIADLVPSCQEAPLCADDEVIFKPIPGNCTAYIICAFGEVYPEYCPPGMLFDPNPEVLQCNVASEVNCDDGSGAGDGSGSGTTLTFSYVVPPKNFDTSDYQPQPNAYGRSSHRRASHSDRLFDNFDTFEDEDWFDEEK